MDTSEQAQTNQETATAGEVQMADERVLDYSLLSQRKAFESSLNSLFPTSEEDNKLQKARGMLGELAQTIPDDELAVYLTQFQYLLDEWLDEYEQELFNGLTLRRLLQDR